MLLALTAIGTLSLSAQAQSLRNHQLVMIRADGSELKQITNNLTHRYGAPQFSPDGQLIAADCVDAAGKMSEAHLVVMNVDGSHERDLGSGITPSWSPDGKSLAFCRQLPFPAIVVVNADGTEPRTVATGGGSPRWTPDGRCLITIADGRSIFNVFDIETRRYQETELPLGAVPFLGFSLSPDGRMICFGDIGRSGLSFATRNDEFAFAGLRNILNGRTCTFCSWSPDGKKIAFAMHDDDPGAPGEIYLLDATGDGEPQRLAGQPDAESNVCPAWSPDSQWIIFSSDPREPDAEAED